MKKITKFKLFALLLAFLCVAFCSCGEKITEEELAAALPELIEASKPLNEIYFGEGFSINGEISDVVAGGGYYYCDCEDYMLFSINDIRDATREVFTEEYSQILFEAAFEGVFTESEARAPRYTEGTLGLMQNAADTVYVLPKREFDYESLHVTRSDGDEVTVAIDTRVDGALDVLSLVVVRCKAEDGSYTYRLDSPTY